MQSQFNINDIIENYKLDINELSMILYPAVKHPNLALNRVIKGETNLDTTQIQALASYIGVSVQDLFNNDWKSSIDNGHLVFTNGPYKARLNYQGAFLVLYKNEKLVKKEILNTQSMLLTDFIDHINDLIKKY